MKFTHVCPSTILVYVVHTIHRYIEEKLFRQHLKRIRYSSNRFFLFFYLFLLCLVVHLCIACVEHEHRK